MKSRRWRDGDVFQQNRMERRRAIGNRGRPLLLQVVTLLASLAMGINVYMMSMQFRSMQGPVAAGLVLLTLLSSITTPVVLTLTSGGG